MAENDSPGAEPPSWHDNLIYGFALRPPDPDSGDWRSELHFDIDHILEWICGTDGGVRFRIAPATLTFHDVTALRIALDFAGGHQAFNLNALSISEITSEAPPAPGATTDRPFWRWRIALNDPQGGEIAFGSSGYTLSPRGAEMVRDQPFLPPAERPGWNVTETG